MKKIILTISLLTLGTGLVMVNTRSCTTIATSSIGVSVIKKILLGAIVSAENTFSNKEAFLRNDLIIKALPDNLQFIYSKLNSISPNTAQKTKEYIADVASETVNISSPILKNAVEQLDKNDINRIINGGNGMATKVLREKTEKELFYTLLPKVEQEMNRLKVKQTIDPITNGLMGISNFLGGKQNNNNFKIENLATEQLVNGIYLIIEKYENDYRKEKLNEKK